MLVDMVPLVNTVSGSLLCILIRTYTEYPSPTSSSSTGTASTTVGTGSTSSSSATGTTSTDAGTGATSASGSPDGDAILESEGGSGMLYGIIGNAILLQ